MQDAFQGMRACQEPRPSARPCSVASRVCAPSPDLKLANRELGTVEGIGQDGRMSLKMDGGRPEDRVVELYPATHPRLDHGYSVTSHSSQGQTADRVLMRPSLRSFIVSSMNSRNRHRVWPWLFCALPFWFRLRKKGRRTPAPRAQGTCSRQNWLRFTQFPCTVPTQPKIGMLCPMKTM